MCTCVNLSDNISLALSLHWAYLAWPLRALLSSPHWDLRLHGILLDKACFQLDLALTAHSSTTLVHAKHTRVHAGPFIVEWDRQTSHNNKTDSHQEKGMKQHLHSECQTGGTGKTERKKRRKHLINGGLQYGVWSASLAVSVFITDWTTLGVNTVMKDASESKEHKTTYLVDQRQTHTWQAAAARHWERNTTRERQHNINTQPMWGLTVAQQNKNQGHVKIDSASHGVVNRNKKKNNSNKANQTIKQIKGGKYVLPWCKSETSHCDVTKLYTLWMMCYFSMCRPRKF